MPDEPIGRWPPVYDADDLRQVIADLATDHFFQQFYQLSTVAPDGVCQGDVIRLESDVPAIDDQGEPAAINLHESLQYWLVIGNTCDFERSHDDVWCTQVVPILDVEDQATEEFREALRRYQMSRLFFVPPWPQLADERDRVAHLSVAVSLDKRAFSNGHAVVVARLRFTSWVLLHACLIRFLCRADGRFA